VEEVQNGTFTALWCDVSSFVTVTFQSLEHPWVVKILLLVFLGNILSVLSKVSKQIMSIIWRYVPRLDSYKWQGAWSSMGKCLGRREHSQAASPTWPAEIFHAIDVILILRMGVDRGAGTLFFHELKLFLISLASLAKSVSSVKCVSSTITAQGLAANWSSCGEKKITLLLLVVLVFPLLPY